MAATLAPGRAGGSIFPRGTAKYYWLWVTVALSFVAFHLAQSIASVRARPAPESLPAAWSGVDAAAESLGYYLRLVVQDFVSSAPKIWGLANIALVLEVGSFYLFVAMFLGALSRDDIVSMQDRLASFSAFKLIIIFFVLDPILEVEWVLWIAWYAGVAVLDVLAALVRRRFEETQADMTVPRSTRSRHISLLLTVLGLNTAMFVGVCAFLGPVDLNFALLMVADCAITGLSTMNTLRKYRLFVAECDARAAHTTAAAAAAAATLGSGASPAAAVTSPTAAHSAAAAYDMRSDSAVYFDAGWDAFTLFLTMLHYFHVWTQRGVRLSMVDIVLGLHLVSVGRALKARWTRLATFRNLNHQLDSAFLDASTAELQAAPGDPGFGGSGVKECAICLDPMAGGKVLPLCKHVFHRACLRRWLVEGNDTCPLCRQGLSREAEAARLRRSAPSPPPPTAATATTSTTSSVVDAPESRDAIVVGPGDAAEPADGEESVPRSEAAAALLRRRRAVLRAETVGTADGPSASPMQAAPRGSSGGQAPSPAPPSVAAPAPAPAPRGWGAWLLSAAGGGGDRGAETAGGGSTRARAYAAELQQLEDMFPQASPAGLSRLLQSLRGDVSAAVTEVLAGRVQPITAAEAQARSSARANAAGSTSEPAASTVSRPAPAAVSAFSSVAGVDRPSPPAAPAPSLSMASTHRASPAAAAAAAATAPAPAAPTPRPPPSAGGVPSWFREVDSGDESAEIDSEVMALTWTAQAAGVQPDRFEMCDATAAAMVRRGRRNYKRKIKAQLQAASVKASVTVCVLEH